VALGIHERLPDVESVPARRIRIESDVPVPIQVDGDPAGWTPAEICVLPAALQVIVPDDSRGSTG
jgi:diacylglycerol kinase family enzyme